MSSDTARNQVRHIIESERKAREKVLTEEQMLFRKAEVIAKEVVARGREVFNADRNAYNRPAMLDLLKRLYQSKFLDLMSKEDMACLLAEIHAQETISAVEVL